VKVEEWLYIVYLTVIGVAVAVYASDNKAPGTYDKRNWACAEYDVDVDADEQVCIRMERTVNR
jgi:hypothetical protein